MPGLGSETRKTMSRAEVPQNNSRHTLEAVVIAEFLPWSPMDSHPECVFGGIFLQIC